MPPPAPAATADGQDKVIAAAQHIVKSLATSTDAEDMIRILSGFDHRLSHLLPSQNQPPSEAELRLRSAEELLLHWESSDCLLFEASSDEVAEYLDAVDVIISLAGDPEETRPRAEIALQISMARLEDEFLNLMIRQTLPLDPEAEKVQGPPDLIQPEAVADLKAIADRMVLAGYGKELCQVYSVVRRDVLDERLSVLGVERTSIDEVQRMEWRILDDRMRKWIHALGVAFSMLLPSERRVCNRIFGESSGIGDECFAEAAKGCVTQLLNFGDAVAVGQRSSEKLFRILGMHEALARVMSDIRDMFPGDAGEIIVKEAELILKSLGDAVKGTINEFGNAVHREPSRKPMQGGDIHPLTRYVINYVKLFLDYKDSLNLLLDESAPEARNPAEGGERDESIDLGGMNLTGRRLLLIISYLEENLEEKSKLYEDDGMRCVFLMNNLQYIVQKVKGSELLGLLGDRWVRRRRAQVRQYATSYLRASWMKALSLLRDDGFGGNGSFIGSSNSSSNKAAIKEKFKNFNMAFEEIYRTQTTWKVPDPQLREELRISISEKVLPAYRSFIGRFGGHLDSGRRAAKYVKYTLEDLENYLLDLFEGLPAGLPNHPRRKPTS